MRGIGFSIRRDMIRNRNGEYGSHLTGPTFRFNMLSPIYAAILDMFFYALLYYAMKHFLSVHLYVCSSNLLALLLSAFRSLGI